MRAWLLALLMLLALPAWAQHEGVMRLRRAEFATGVDGPWQKLELPDSWARRGLATGSRGIYRVEFELQARPQLPWALWAERLSSAHELWINGQHLSGDLGADALQQRGRMQTLWVGIPPAMLRPGVNTLELRVDNGPRAGLSVLNLGPAEEMAGEFERADMLWADLPRWLNVGGASLSAFLLLIWWRRRSEVAIGCVGALWLMSSVRNYSYFTHNPLNSHVLVDWLYFSSFAVAVLLLGLLAMALAGRQLLWWRRSLYAAAVGLPLLAALLLPWGLLLWIRAWAFPLMILLSLPALWLVLRHARDAGWQHYRGFAVGLVLVLAAGVHDYFYHQGHTTVMDRYWMPLLMPVVLALFSWTLITRMINAMAEVQHLNTELEQRVAQRTRALELANAAKSRFLSSASHDLRQPVVAIGLSVGLMREQVEAPAQRRMLDQVIEAVGALERLLVGLLDLSRLDSGTVRTHVQSVRLQPLFDAIAVHEADHARSRGLRLRFRPSSLTVMSDPVLLEQILRNLVSNALRYTRRGGVLVAARRRGTAVLLQVWDSGIGIAPADQVTIFEEFVQVDNPARQRRPEGGMGLGLAIVRRSANLLGHRLSLASRLGRGSCFSLLLPQGELLKPLAPAPVEAEPLSLVGMRVLLVEDDDAVRASLKARLQAWGATVLAHGSGQSLLSALPVGVEDAALFADLLISDQRLPDIRGIALVKQVQERCGGLPALLITGDTAPEQLAELQASGVPVLHKPFRAEALMAALEKLLSAQPASELSQPIRP
ncbi:hybrid sensor histidine kinase/response regulator [Pelomonas sp. SE-A7]|uniref:hybrid sensor histidine kinase/response regulator n=1 Tax=Pelomonas sp. SE-A7 TaxID=3054953 RepID=UPI00259C78FB|nr:hybrid sensor histidine kinase/response regulator [Pelomonas sp. SE-A7]MDM4768389.1 hybrid sensor histidine kinase/response regulator [Pelomonas sp. SE-A7]